MFFGKACIALWRGDQSEKAHIGCAGFLHLGHRRRRRAARGKHRVNHHRYTLVHVVGQFVVIPNRLQSFVIAVHAKMADPRDRNQIEQALQQTVTRAQHGDKADFLALNFLRLHRRNRGFDIHRFHWQIAQDFIGEQHRNFAQQTAETRCRGVLLAHQGEFVLDEGMSDDVEIGHSNALSSWISRTLCGGIFKFEAAPQQRQGREVDQSALSVIMCVQAPSGALVMTGSDPPSSSEITVRA